MKIINTKEITHPLKIFPLICCIYTSIVITLIALSGRIFFLNFPLVGKIFVGSGFFLVPFLFFMQNVITEVYGYEMTQKLNKMSLIGALIFFLYNQVTIFMPVPPNIPDQLAFNAVAKTYFRHFFAFIFALYFGAKVNQYLIAKLKNFLGGKWLGLRSIISTFLGDFTFQVIGSIISRFHVLKFSEILFYDLFSYFYKILFQLASLPLIYILSQFLKEIENIDIYDKNIRFNSLKMKF